VVQQVHIITTHTMVTFMQSQMAVFFLQAYERELPEAHEWFKIYIMTSDAILAARIWVSAV